MIKIKNIIIWNLEQVSLISYCDEDLPVQSTLSCMKLNRVQVLHCRCLTFFSAKNGRNTLLFNLGNYFLLGKYLVLEIITTKSHMKL